ncbi:hypothetical protein TNCV_581711 [Trichonephila clavipes]|nr:hypothetical protein TNCV_581711 [Trichonephila clavipes]
MGPGYIFMVDNGQLHKIQIVDEFHERENIRHMDSPSRTLDLNPIEHVWNGLQRDISKLIVTSRRSPGVISHAFGGMDFFATNVY